MDEAGIGNISPLNMNREQDVSACEVRLRMFLALARTLDPVERARIAAEAAAGWTDASFGICSLRDGITGVSEALQEIPGDVRMTLAPGLRGAETLRYDDLGRDPRLEGEPPLQGMPPGIRPWGSCFSAPIVSAAGDICGHLVVGHPQPAFFSGRAGEILEAVAAQMAIAIDHGRLTEAARRGAEARQEVEETNAWFAAIVESSDDAILSKSLEGIISSWNAGARRLFGFTAEEAVGKPVTILIPEDRLYEEEDILRRIRRGERVEHYETVRRRKDGSLLDISLTVSPVRDASGAIIGASKIARDISERKRGQERQRLLLREMNHRVKNLFAVTTGLISIGALSAADADDLATSLRERVLALSRAHDLTLPDLDREVTGAVGTTLFALLSAIVAPHDGPEGSRMALSGVDVPLQGAALTSLALVLHEFTTNAAKYGAFSTASGRLLVRTAIEGETLSLCWTEAGGPPVVPGEDGEGFGSLLERATVEGLGGEIVRDWAPGGLVIRLRVPLARISGEAT